MIEDGQLVALAELLGVLSLEFKLRVVADCRDAGFPPEASLAVIAALGAHMLGHAEGMGYVVGAPEEALREAVKIRAGEALAAVRALATAIHADVQAARNPDRN